MIKRSRRKPETKKFYRINERIYAQTMRVLDPEGKQIGILSKNEALEKARELELDLVEVAPTAKPPVARIVDFNKFLYQQEKKKREEKRKAKVTETKEVRFGPFMNDHDLETMVRRAREFLDNSDKVKLVVRFAGRQITHPEFGEKILEKAVASLSDISKIERERHFEGRQLIVILSPEKNKNGKEKNQEISQ